MNRHHLDAGVHRNPTWLHAYLDGELAPGERVAVEAHLRSCEACRDRLAALRALFDELDALQTPRLARDLGPAVLDALGARPPEESSLAVRPGAVPVSSESVDGMVLRRALLPQAAAAAVLLAHELPAMVERGAHLGTVAEWETRIAAWPAFLEAWIARTDAWLELVSREAATVVVAIATEAVRAWQLDAVWETAEATMATVAPAAGATAASVAVLSLLSLLLFNGMLRRALAPRPTAQGGSG